MIRINNVSGTIFKTVHGSVVSDNEKYDKVDNVIRKRNYIEARTKDYTNFSGLNLLMSLMTGVTNINFENKLSTKNKVSLGFCAVAVVSYIAKVVKSWKLSNEYDNKF